MSNDVYLVVIDGAGEYKSDFNVLEIRATSARDAVEKVTAPEMGYGRNEDGIAFVFPLDDAEVFSINDSTRKAITPASAEDYQKALRLDA